MSVQVNPNPAPISLDEIARVKMDGIKWFPQGQNLYAIGGDQKELMAKFGESIELILLDQSESKSIIASFQDKDIKPESTPVFKVTLKGPKPVIARNLLSYEGLEKIMKELISNNADLNSWKRFWIDNFTSLKMIRGKEVYGSDEFNNLKMLFVVPKEKIGKDAQNHFTFLVTIDHLTEELFAEQVEIFRTLNFTMTDQELHAVVEMAISLAEPTDVRYLTIVDHLYLKYPKYVPSQEIVNQAHKKFADKLPYNVFNRHQEQLRKK